MKWFLLVALLLLVGLIVIWQYATVSPHPLRSDTPAAPADESLPVPPDGVADVKPQLRRSAPKVTVRIPPAGWTPIPDFEPAPTPVIVREPTPTPAPPPEVVYASGQVDPPDPAGKSVAARLRQYGASARRRLAPWFHEAGVDYPPAGLLLVGLKQEELLKVYALTSDRRAQWRFVCQYPIVALGDSLGPKLRQGDRQTPEGIYRVNFLNPQSSYHLSLGINYPNEFDWKQARRDRRSYLGGDIMIHGSHLSDGCLAMGNTAATDLFVLVADTGIRNTEVLLSPVDFRVEEHAKLPNRPGWTGQLYADLRSRMAKLDDGISTQARLVRYRDTRRPATAGIRRKTVPQHADSLAMIWRALGAM